MKQFKRILLFILICFLSLMLGSILGKVAGLSLNSNSPIYNYVSTGLTLNLPLYLNLQVLLLDLYLTVTINALGLLGLLLGIILFFKLKL